MRKLLLLIVLFAGMVNAQEFDFGCETCTPVETIGIRKNDYNGSTWGRMENNVLNVNDTLYAPNYTRLIVSDKTIVAGIDWYLIKTDPSISPYVSGNFKSFFLPKEGDCLAEEIVAAAQAAEEAAEAAAQAAAEAAAEAERQAYINENAPAIPGANARRITIGNSFGPAGSVGSQFFWLYDLKLAGLIDVPKIIVDDGKVYNISFDYVNGDRHEYASTQIAVAEGTWNGSDHDVAFVYDDNFSCADIVSTTTAGCNGDCRQFWIPLSEEGKIKNTARLQNGKVYKVSKGGTVSGYRTIYLEGWSGSDSEKSSAKIEFADHFICNN